MVTIPEYVGHNKSTFTGKSKGAYFCKDCKGSKKCCTSTSGIREEERYIRRKACECKVAQRQNNPQ